MLSGIAALGCGVPLNLLCNLRGITDFLLPVKQDLNLLLELKKKKKKTPCSVYSSLGLIGLSLKEANKYSELWSLFINTESRKTASDSHSWKLLFHHSGPNSSISQTRGHLPGVLKKLVLHRMLGKALLQRER